MGNRFVKFLSTWPGMILGGIVVAAIVIANGVISGHVTINWPL